MMVQAEINVADAPIGVFDSGLGGLTLVQQVQAQLPQEKLIYVADQTHVPYGGRELREVCGFACGISEGLLVIGCKAIVMACNISSATALPTVQAEHPHIPIIGVIGPGAQVAALQTQNGRVGVLATEGTVRSGAYTRTLHAQNPALVIAEVACPAFVPLVETGRTDTLEAYAAAREYLAPLLALDVDTIILGCTHYPFLLPTLRDLAPHLCFVDPAERTVAALAALLAAKPQTQGLRTSEKANPDLLLTTTGDVATFAAQTRRFLPTMAHRARFAAARWQSGNLTFDPT